MCACVASFQCRAWSLHPLVKQQRFSGARQSNESHAWCLLLQNHAMSHVQLLRAILHALADPRTFSQGIFMQWDESQGSQKADAPSQQAMRKAFDVVFVDSSGCCNLAAHVSESALQQASTLLLLRECVLAKLMCLLLPLFMRGSGCCKLTTPGSKSVLR